MKDFERKLKEFMLSHLNQSPLSEAIQYSVLPTGKAFRPKLVYALAKDAQIETSDLDYLAIALELHHVYTLIHDDLPCMDDDDYRRGKLSNHKKYNEAIAVLCGDSLLNLSYEALTELKSKHVLKIISLFTKRCGANGLINGQYLDLDGKISNLEKTIHIHKLKTSELMLVALKATNILSEKVFSPDKIEALSISLGIVFQLLDDLSEMTPKVCNHEKSINPFYLFEASQCYRELMHHFDNIKRTVSELKLNALKQMINEYFIEIDSTLNKNEIELVTGLKIPRMVL